MKRPPFTLKIPQTRTTSIVFASPHSGRSYSHAFRQNSLLDAHILRSSEDAYVDQLYAAAPQHGAPFLTANAPRAFVDLNRAQTELDPALIQDVPRADNNPRVLSGLGVIPRVVAGGRAISLGKMPLYEAQMRLKEYWQPYHNRLQTLLDESRALFGNAILVDCHSMPHEAVKMLAATKLPRPEIVIGDRFGASASGHIVDQIEAAFRQEGFITARNIPFAGAYIAQHYGRPSRAQHTVQIEIDRSLYLDESAIQPNDSFDAVKSALTAVINKIVCIGQDNKQLAAE